MIGLQNKWTPNEEEIADDVIGFFGKEKAEEFYQKYKYNRLESENDLRWDECCKELEKKIKKELDPLKKRGCFVLFAKSRVKEFNSMIRRMHEKWLEDQTDKHRGKPAYTKHETFEWDKYILKLGDIIGVRIVGLNLNDVVKIVRRILSSEDFTWQRSDIKNYYEEAKKSHYRSWQVPLKFHYKNTEKTVPVEIQVRSVLEEAWAEWSHQLFYKPPKGMPQAVWESLRRIYDKEAIDHADSLFEIAKATDRLREIFDISHRSVPEHITRELAKWKGNSCSDALVEFFEPFGIKVLTGNFETGLRKEQVYIDWNNKEVNDKKFVGLQLKENTSAKSSICIDKKEDRRKAEERQRFDFSELNNGELELYGVEDELGNYLNQHGFVNKARELLKTCFELKKEPHRTFFNEYQARLNNFGFDQDTPLKTSILFLELSKTNFAFEVCTTYVLESSRMIVPGENGMEHAEVTPLKDELSKVLTAENSQFRKCQHAANPIGVHVNLIYCPSSEACKRLYIMRRGMKAALHQGQWGTSVSGVMVPRKDSIESAGDIPGLVYDIEDENGNIDSKPCVFRAVQRELEEELGLYVPIDHIRIIALLRDIETGQPILVAEAYTDKTLKQISSLKSTAPENWEVDRLTDIELTPKGLKKLFSNPNVGKFKKQEIKLPQPTLTKRNAEVEKGVTEGKPKEGFWQARSAVAVLLIYCRYVGSEEVEKKLKEHVTT